MPQNMLTEPVSDMDELEPLSPEEVRFVEALAVSSSYVEAYKKAYGAEGYAPASLRVRACRKAAEPKIQAHIRSLRAHGLANARLTMDERLEEMLSAAQRAENAGNFGAALGFHKEINELLGLKTVQINVTGEQDPIATLKSIAQYSPEVAEQMAKQHNIPWTPATVGADTRH